MKIGQTRKRNAYKRTFLPLTSIGSMRWSSSISCSSMNCLLIPSLENKGKAKNGKGKWKNCYQVYDGSPPSLQPVCPVCPPLSSALDAGLCQGQSQVKIMLLLVLLHPLLVLILLL